MTWKNRNLSRGFTMLELTLVGIIITILIAIALPNFLEAQIRANVTAANTDMALLSQALEEYFIEYRAYPPNRVEKLPDGGLTGDGDPETRGLGLVALTTPTPFVGRLPEDRFGPQQTTYQRYDYVNFLDWRGETLTRRYFADEGTCAYVLASVAPNDEPELKVGQFPPEALVYSPTNGVVSEGDLYMLGP
jgi:type II secretory pathway pseudopilin PulG